MSTSWLEIPKDSDFSIHNLPFGVFSRKEHERYAPRCATILGDTVIDLSVLEEAGVFSDIPGLSCGVFCQSTLNSFIEHPKPVWLAVRQRLVDLFASNSISPSAQDTLQKNLNLRAACLHPIDTVVLHLPVQVGDYTDFYSSREHATNVGTMFRGKDNALQPNWLHLPVGYHGRSSTVCISGTPVRRPYGQLQKDASDEKLGSIHAPCRLLDFELEVAAVIGGPPNALGSPLTMEQAKDRIFGLLLMNDWSARDIQKWEYVPLGPFTSKNFCTTVSPWIVMTVALEAATTSAGTQSDPVPLPYLQDPEYSSYDIALSVALATSAQTTEHIVCSSNFRNLYWNSAQQLVHHTVSGCVMKAGDLLGSGTISGSSESSFGSMLELSWKGSREVPVGGGEVRKFLQDGDTVILKGVCTKPDGAKVGFGACVGKIHPAVGAGTVAELGATPSSLGIEPRFSEFVLYSYWRSSSAWRVRVALAAKAIVYTTVPINLLKFDHRAEEYLAKNPSGQVPLLEFTDNATGKRVRLSQSLSIIRFLDKAFPKSKSLIPQDPLDEAAALEIFEVINSGTQPLQNRFFLDDLEQQSEGKITALSAGKSANEKGLRTVEKLVRRLRDDGTAEGPFSIGSFAPTIADACLVPQLYNARRFGVDVDTVCPTLVEIALLCESHPWFQAAHADAQPDAVTEN
jgi:fumarylacetoacetase